VFGSKHVLQSTPVIFLAGCNISEIDVKIEIWLVDPFRFAKQALLFGFYARGTARIQSSIVSQSIGSASFKRWMQSMWGTVKESLRYMTEQQLN